MEWTREKTLALINEYRKRRGLWDMTHDDYRKKEMKQKLLVEVSSSLGGGIPIVEVEKKFHTLRTQYHREINRMKRKEPYNSKWFGFKNLQFLSSPKACRSNKGRVKAEITEDGIVTTKYILRDPIDHNSTNISDEFLIHRKPRIYDTESRVNTTNAGNSNTTRSQELEKLIEETTKDVEDIDDTKPKITIKEIAVSMEHHTYSNQMHGSNGELSGTEQDPLQHQEEHQGQDDHQMEEEDEPIETIDIQPVDEDGSYTATTVAGAGITHNQNVGNGQHQGMTRIIKIQRRDPTDDYYEENNQQQPTSTLNRHSNALKRVYYDNNGQVQAPTLLNSTPKTLNQSAASSRSLPQFRDEFETYGEYVGNEMRNITNREVLISLKHKINTALFEASMAEIQK